jgi:hypothetical protein
MKISRFLLAWWLGVVICLAGKREPYWILVAKEFQVLDGR